jgi:hypothetical protein
MDTNTEQDRKNAEMLMEIRLRRQWKQDAQNIASSVLADVLSHIDAKVEAAVTKQSEQLRSAVRSAIENQATKIDKKIADQDVKTRGFEKHLEDIVASIAVRVLDEYRHELRKEYFEAGLLSSNDKVGN